MTAKAVVKVRRFAVIGDPVAHSMSPVMHAAAYRALHLPHTYDAIRATPEELPGLVSVLRDGVFDGFNVTVPHKRRILDHVDGIDPSAATVGAANTLVRGANGRIVAHNTDVAALAGEVQRLAPERLAGGAGGASGAGGWSGARALVLGTGGAARSAVLALGLHVRVGEILVRGRALDDAAKVRAFEGEMAGFLARSGSKAKLRAAPWRASPEEEATLAVVVQATSAGMHGAEPGEAAAAAVAWEHLPASAVALDVIYAPPVTPFLAAASAHGVRSVNGFGMLAGQGALAFELWLGVPAPYNAMLTALV